MTVVWLLIIKRIFQEIRINKVQEPLNQQLQLQWIKLGMISLVLKLFPVYSISLTETKNHWVEIGQANQLQDKHLLK